MSVGASIEFKEQVRARTDIVSLVGESIALTPRRGGLEYVALCPFHDDHNPSFHVYPDRQSYRCWVCNEGGDCFGWVMKIENVGFREALEMLAERARLELPQTYRNRGGPGGKAKADLYSILVWAEREYHSFLLEAPGAEAARQYLLGDRGLTLDTIKAFRLGFHPRNWEWLLNRVRGVYTPQQLAAARLVRQRRDGDGYYDDFVGRVLFPIHDIRGRTVAFGGRILPGEQDSQGPKYLNSPESAVFAKGKLVFGLDVAREAIRKSGTAVVTEGYTDCIIAHQHGITNAVGTLGTALTDSHVIELKRCAERVVLVYDGDQAGQNAAEKSLPRFLAYDTDLRLLTLPEGLDPADFLAKRGATALRTLIAEAVDALDYKLRIEIDRHGLESVRARETVMNQVLELLCEAPRMSGTSREDMILGQLARRLNVPEGHVRHHLVRLRKGRTKRPSNVRFDASAEPPEVSSGDRLLQGTLSGDDKLECELLEIILAAPQVFEHVAHQVTGDDFSNTSLRQLFEACRIVQVGGRQPSTDQVVTLLEDPELKRVAVWIEAQAAEKGVPELLSGAEAAAESSVLIRQILDRVKWRRQRKSHERLRGQMAHRQEAASGLDADGKALLRQAAEFHQKRTGVKSNRTTT